jgi:hypothetical protein
LFQFDLFHNRRDTITTPRRPQWPNLR